MDEPGKVRSTFFGTQDHGLLTFWVHIEFDSFGVQGFGGFQLDQWDSERQRNVGTAFGCDVYLQLLRFFQVEELSKAVGQRVIAVKPSWNGIIREIRREADQSYVFNMKTIQKQWGIG